MKARAQPSDRRAGWILFAVAFLLLAPGAYFGFPPSGGKTAAGALRVLAGEVPYRDFWTMYAPGQFYAGAGLFAVFGRDIVVLALATCAVRAAGVVALFVLVRRLGAGKRAACAAALLFAVASFEAAPELGSYAPALLLLLCALECVRAALAERRADRFVQAGLAFGAAAWFKHDVAAYACAATGLALCALAAQERRSPAPEIGRVAAGALVALAPVAILLAVAAGGDAWRDLIVFPAGDFRVVRGESYPPFLPALASWRAWLAAPGDLNAARAATSGLSRTILAHLPELLFAALAARLWLVRRELARDRFAVATLALCAMPIFWAAAHVQQNTHLTSMALLACIAWAALGPYASRRARTISATAAALYALGLWIPAGQDAFLALRALRSGERLDLPGARVTRVTHAEADVYRSVADFVRVQVPPGEPIYCGVARHDAIVVGNQRWHMLCERPPAVRWGELHPGVTDREDVQRELIAELESRGVRCAVLWRFGWPDSLLDDILRRRMSKLPGTGAQLLDRYLAANFEPVFERGEYVVLRRRTAAAR